MSLDSELPTTAPDRLLVEGLLEGRVLSPDRLRTAAAALDGCGAGAFRLEITGGRFSLLPLTPKLRDNHFDGSARARFFDALQGIVDATEPGSVESNLRCRMLYGARIVETLFAMQAGRVVPVARQRERTADDEAWLADDATRSLRPRRRLELVLVLLAALALMWQFGWIDRALTPKADALRLDTGPFATLLTLQATRNWGGYDLELRRGPDFPRTAAGFEQLSRASDDPARRAAVALLGKGGDLFVQLRTGEPTDEALAEVRVPMLRLQLADDVVQARIDGHRLATTLRLSLVGEQ